MNINSIWDISGIDGICDGRYRVLSIYFDMNICIVFQMDKGPGVFKMPRRIRISELEMSVSRGESSETSVVIPPFQTIDECNIPESNKEKRDEYYSLIQPLIDDHLFLLDIVMKKRNQHITSYAAEKKIYKNKLYRILSRYWFYGQEKNALLPSWPNCGGTGQPRIAGEAKRGAPLKQSPFMSMTSFYRNVTEEDKEIFLKGIRKYGPENEKWSISAIYRSILADYYLDEIRKAEAEMREPSLPSERSFRYWLKRLIHPSALIEKQVSRRDYLLRKRALRGSATDHTSVPGSCFELDATVLDVHIVSSFNRQWVLGRPVLYLVVDKESRMIVGLHVSMEYASWRAGRQALVNSFTNKKQFCARFGITISDDDWPCHHIPQKLLCDRGEFICQKPEEIVVPLIGNLSIAPSWRADVKGIVERRFKILNDELIHNLMGTTKGRHYIRGDKDPRREACFTLDEVTSLLIAQILEHNDSIKDALIRQSRLLPEYSLSPTPRNYWNIHLKLHRHALRHASEAEIRAKLLPCRWVSMTSRGIRLNDDMYYECHHGEFEALKVVARHSGRIKLEARIDQDNSSFIYVRFNDSEEFTMCTLMAMSSNYNGQHEADIQTVMAWKKNITSGPHVSAVSAERMNTQQNTIRESGKTFKRNRASSPEVRNIRDIRMHRQNAINFQRNGYSGDMRDVTEYQYGPERVAPAPGVRTQSETVGLLKRKP